jgi:hypothetical protein
MSSTHHIQREESAKARLEFSEYQQVQVPDEMWGETLSPLFVPVRLPDPQIVKYIQKAQYL